MSNGNEPYVLLKTLYLPSKYETNEKGMLKKLRKDAMYIAYIDKAGNRRSKLVFEPQYTFYYGEKYDNYHRLSVPKEDCIPVTCKYEQRYNEMARVVGKQEEYKAAKQDWALKEEWIKRKLMASPKIYHADIDIEDFYKSCFLKKYGDYTRDVKYKTSFTDIECRADLGDVDARVAEVPICSMQHLDTTSKVIYYIVLKDDENKAIENVFSNPTEFVQSFIDFLEKDVKPRMKTLMQEAGADEDQIQKALDSLNFKYKLKLCNTEKEMIETYFKIIKDTRPDFCGIWNINFDIQYIARRSAMFNIDIANLISDESIPPEYRHFEFREDPQRYNKKSALNFSRFFDNIFSTCNTQWYCQMSMFSNLRRRWTMKNYKLDYIGEKYGYINKVDLRDLGYNIRDVYTKNFNIHSQYAIIDVIVQYCIERNTDDIQRYQQKCAKVRFSKGFGKTYLVKQELTQFLDITKNEIIGNNINYDIDEGKIPGAIVASPSLLRAKGLELK
jgi:hypothetical protein